MFHCRWVLSPLHIIWSLLRPQRFNVAALPGLYSFWWRLLGRRIIFQLERKVSLLLCAWHEMTISSSPNDYDYGGWWWFLMMMLLMMMVVVDEERSKQKKKCLFFEFKVSGSYSINIKHTQSLKGKSKSTYTLHSTNIKCSINQGMFWDWSCFLNFHQI